MRRVVFTSFAFLSLLCISSAAVGQTTFTLGFDAGGASSFKGNAGEAWNGTCTATLAAEGTGTGAQGWSISLSADGASITDITTNGTDVDALFSGGFKKSELTTKGAGDCAGKNGAVSAVVLSFTEPITLLAPPSVSKIATLGVAGTIPAGGGEATVAYINNCQGAGQPVQNNITQDGNTVPPVLGTKRIALTEIVSCCGPTHPLNVGFTAGNVASAAPYDGILDDGAGLCSGAGGVIEIAGAPGTPASGKLFAAISSEGAGDGVQGWSFSFGVDGAITLTSATTNGTSVDRLFSGGFKKTELTAGAGNEGAVSAVVLSFTEPIVLPPTGTESVVEFTVGGEFPAEGGVNAGNVSFTSGRKGSGQPVTNALTVGGATVNACNFETASVRVQLVPVTDRVFIRGNANNDSKVNIADAIWVINELFKAGPATVCRDAADVNNDAMIDLADATYLITHQFAGGTAPPAPYPDCGPDPEGDDDGVLCDADQTVCP